MSEIVKKNWPLIQFVCTTRNQKAIKCILENLTRNQVRLLSEISLNVLIGNISISKYYKKKLKRQKNLLTSWTKESELQKRKSFANNVATVKELLKASYKVLQTVT